MGIDATTKSNWIEVQKKNNAPVNALGMKIDAKDEKSMKVWREEGIDKHLAR